MCNQHKHLHAAMACRVQYIYSTQCTQLHASNRIHTQNTCKKKKHERHMGQSCRLTYPHFQQLQGKQQRVQNEQLALAAAALPAYHIHCTVLAQGYACVHSPPLVPAHRLNSTRSNDDQNNSHDDKQYLKNNNKQHYQRDLTLSSAWHHYETRAICLVVYMPRICPP